MASLYMKLILMVGFCALGLWSCKQSAPVTPPSTPGGGISPTPTPIPGAGTGVVREKELMITDLSVVEDARATTPGGHWTFGHLISEMAGPPVAADAAGQALRADRASVFVRSWLQTWETDQTINTFTVAARPNIKSLVIDPWKKRDGVPGIDTAQWKPNLANAPFRLLAIVNRIDLNRGTPARVDSAGEGRFVFGVLGPTSPANPDERAPLLFTVIFEYELLAKNRAELRGWAQRWRELGQKQFGAEYNAALQTITDVFTTAGKAPTKAHQNCLNQLRTNEIQLVLPAEAARGWELREFRLIVGQDQLRPSPVQQNPSNSFDKTPELADFINLRTPELLDGTLVMKEKLDDGKAFLGGSSIVAPPTVGFFWDAPQILNNEARHNFSSITCNGCHHVETGTDNFMHVAVREAGQPSRLSKFLNGPGLPPLRDPKDNAVARPFVDDLGVRAEILKELAAEPGPTIRLNTLQRSRQSRVH